MNEFIREAEVYMSLRPHKNAVVFLGVCTKPLCILTEFCPMGSLEAFLKSDAKIDMPTVIRMACDISAGMAHLHAEGVVHRDLASRNLLLDAQLNIKITDFGLSRVMTESETNFTQSEVGPLKWMAPESITSKEYSPKTDVYMFGMTMIEILTRQEPYPGESAMDVAIKVVRDGYQHPIPDHCPADLAQIIRACWNVLPEDRPDFKAVYGALVSMQ